MLILRQRRPPTPTLTDTLLAHATRYRYPRRRAPPRTRQGAEPAARRRNAARRGDDQALSRWLSRPVRRGGDRRPAISGGERRPATGGHGPLAAAVRGTAGDPVRPYRPRDPGAARTPRSEEHTSELQSLMRNSYAVFCLKKKKN